MIGALIVKRTLTHTFESLNRRDMAQFLAVWSADGEFIYPGDIPVSGHFKGKDRVESWFQGFLDQFPEIHFTVRDVCVRNIYDLVGNNVAAVHWDVQLKNKAGYEGQNRGITLVTIRGGKAVCVEDFLFDLGDIFHRLWGAA